jgi:hypothetical protein
MNAKYFKFRTSFNFRPHPYDIGNAFQLWNRSSADRQFLLKLCELGEDEYKGFYTHHLDHNLKNQITSEEIFFEKLWYLVSNHINHLKNPEVTDSNPRLHAETIYKLRQFQEFLNNIDRWNARPAKILIAEKDFMILYYKEENKALKKQLAGFNHLNFEKAWL